MVIEDQCLFTCSVAHLSRAQHEESARRTLHVFVNIRPVKSVGDVAVPRREKRCFIHDCFSIIFGHQAAEETQVGEHFTGASSLPEEMTFNSNARANLKRTSQSYKVYVKSKQRFKC